MSLAKISPEQALRLIEEGAILVDIRERDEHLREKVDGAFHLPLSRLDEAEVALHEGKPVIFHCRSGARTAAHSARLAEKVGGVCDAFIVDGGMDAWKKAGLPVSLNRKQPLEMQRQVQIGAGTMGLAGTLLGIFVSPWFLVIPAFVGAGLLMAGVTGFCGMVSVLKHAPWNKSTYGAAKA